MGRILPQLELGPRIGGAKELATRVTFYNGIANTLMVAGFYYQSNPALPVAGVKIQSVLPGVGAFYLALVAGGVCAMAFEHVMMIRAQAEYNQLQQFGEGVSPIRRDVRSANEKLDELTAELEELRDLVNEEE